MNDLTRPEPIAAATLVARASEDHGALAMTVDESWLQGRSCFGGLQIALALRAARAATASEAPLEAPLRSVHVTFVGPVLAGQPVLARAALLRAGRSVTHVRARLAQAGRPCLEATAIFGTARAGAVALPPAPQPPVAIDQARRFPFLPGITPNFTAHYELAWIAGGLPFQGTEPPQREQGRATILARPAAASPYDEAEFLAVTDVIPPQVLSLLGRPAPASSMNCALELIRPDAIYGTRSWIRFEVELHAAHGGYGWQTAHLYDEAGTLLAVSHQSSAVFG